MCETKRYYRAYAKIDMDALEKNIETAYRSLPVNTGIMAVVKTDAYGHGAKNIASFLEKNEMIVGYAVATVDEAMELRDAGINKTILILGYVSPSEYVQIINNNIMMAVYSVEQAEMLSEYAKKNNKTAVCHLKVDTGMNRIGFDAKNEEQIEATSMRIQEITKLPNLEIDGIFMHFASADESDKTKAFRQFDNFRLLLSKLECVGITFKHRHCSNSAAVMDMPEVTFDWVRQGITMYGLLPSDEMKNKVKLFPVMSLKSHVIHIKTIHEGDAVSYGGTYVAKEDRRVATVCIGYGDGYPRQLSNRGYVLIHGKKAPIIGRVCMDQMMVDITDIDNVKIEDTVTLMGRDGKLEITAEELGELSGRFNYELVCDINQRVPRIY